MTKGLIPIDDYDYPLPEARIAQEAVEPRDSSKLLFYNQGKISDHVFRSLPELLPENSTLIFNNAKVIPARIFASNSNGARIEIFLLQPYKTDHGSALNAKHLSRWEVMIGNKKKWKSGQILRLTLNETEVLLTQIEENAVLFEWSSEHLFSELLEEIGKMPLPPYIRHEAGEVDKNRYQTVYSSVSGSVAAPTAGLHFSEEVFSGLKGKHITQAYVTLHVSAGTFLPVKVKNAIEHNMHKEVFAVNKDLLQILKRSETLVGVGTTSCRVLESLYRVAINIKKGKENPFEVGQFDYMHSDFRPTRSEAIDILSNYLDKHETNEIYGETSIMIVPGYQFMMIDGLISNFHQPKSTLLLLISALIGEDWSRVYNHALASSYRFLSYGDSSLLLPKRIF